MNILYIDTTSTVLTTGVVADGVNRFRRIDAGLNGHTKILLGAVDEVLKESGTDCNGLDAVALVTGPGSFTGIRIGAATATAISQATGAKRIAVTAFEIIAYNRAEVTAAVEAGHGNLYVARCKDGAQVETGFITADERKAAEKTTVFVFEPVNGVAETLAAIVAKKAEKGEFVGVFEPFYMRKSQAERNKDEI